MISYSCYHNLYNNYVSITCYSILIYFSLIISQLQYKSGRNYNVNMGLESLPSCADPSIVALMKGNIYFLVCGEVTSYLEGNAWILSELCSIPQCVSFLVQMSSNEIPDCTYSGGLANRPNPCSSLTSMSITNSPGTAATPSQDPTPTRDTDYRAPLIYGVVCGVAVLIIFTIIYRFIKYPRPHKYEINCTYCSCCNKSKSQTYYEGVDDSY